MPQSPTAPAAWITKFVSAEFFEAVLSGCLRFGSLDEYQQTERNEHRLLDNREGRSSHYVKGDLTNASFVLGGNSFVDVTMVGCGQTIVVEESERALIFCATRGRYSTDTHRRFMEAGNDSCTHYVEFALVPFLAATRAFTNSIATRGIWAMEFPIEYLEKDREVSLTEIERISNERPEPHTDARRARIMRNVFTKPVRFEHEAEHRVALVCVSADPTHFEKARIISDPRVRSIFKGAVTAAGRF